MIIPRVERISSGTTRTVSYSPLKYSADWTDSAKAGQEVSSDDIDSATFMLKKRLGTPDSEAVVTKTMDDDITIGDGEVLVLLTPDDTKDLQGTYYGTLRITLNTQTVSDAEDTDYPDVPYIQIDILQGAVEATG